MSNITVSVNGQPGSTVNVDGSKSTSVTVGGAPIQNVVATDGDTVTVSISQAGAPGGQGIQGPPGSVNLSDDTPLPLGTAAAGVSADASRSDHVHELPEISYGDLVDVPSTFTPAVHTHSASAITGLATIATSGSASDLTTGTVPAARLPIATSSAVGGIKVGSGLTITSGVLSATSSGPSLSNATPQPLGTAAAGTSSSASRADHVHAMPSAGSISGLAAIATSGSASDLSGGTVPAARLPVATDSALGAIKVGSGLTISSGVLSATAAGIGWSSTPATSSSSGSAGSVAYDSSYFYVCVATNTWKRTALSTWGGGGYYGGNFTPTAVILTSGTSYTVPSGATSVKVWAVGSGQPYSQNANQYGGRSGAVVYKTWAVTGGQAISYTVGSFGGIGSTGTTVDVNGQQIIASGGGGGSQGGGDGSASINDISTSGQGSPIGGGSANTNGDGCRPAAGDVSGLLAAVALAGGKATEDCGEQPAFGSGGTLIKTPGPGGGGAASGQTVTGAVVLYFT